jgi:hypothetical protein
MGLLISVSMDWFESLTGFREGPHAETRVKLKVEGERLYSLVNSKSSTAAQCRRAGATQSFSESKRRVCAGAPGTWSRHRENRSCASKSVCKKSDAHLLHPAHKARSDRSKWS